VFSNATDICDALTLALRVAEKVELTGGTAGDVRRELEQEWLEIAFAEELSGGNDVSVIAADVGAQEATVEALRAELAEVQRRATEAVSVAQGRLVEAQAALDVERVEVIRDAAARWRLRAVELRAEAERAGNETVVITQFVSTPLGDRRVPELRYKSDEFEAEAAQADANAALCETWLTWFGSDSQAVDSEALEQRVATMELPPELAPTG
jgi:hypothetical protein